MSKEELHELLNHKDALVRKLAEEYAGIMANPFYTPYVTLKCQTDDWCQQLKIGEKFTVTVEGVECETQKGRIDLFAASDSKEFDRAFKFFDSILEFAEKLDKMRAKLTPEEAKKAEEESTSVSYENARSKAIGKK